MNYNEYNSLLSCICSTHAKFLTIHTTSQAALSRTKRLAGKWLHAGAHPMLGERGSLIYTSTQLVSLTRNQAALVLALFKSKRTA